MLNFLGVDPGVSGGVALVSERRAYLGGMRMPTVEMRGKKLIDTRELFRVLSAWEKSHGIIRAAVIEQVHAMPRQGVSSAFTFGRATGAAEGVAMICSDTQHWYTPRVWKKALGLSAAKSASLDAARLRFGEQMELCRNGEREVWSVMANDGVAEAALIAAYHIDKVRG